MGNFFKKYWAIFLIIFLLLIILILWLLLIGKDSEEADTSTPVPAQTNQATKSATPSSQKKEVESDEDLLKKAVSEKTGIPIDIIVVDVSENTGKYSKGFVNAKGEAVGGGYWLAYKENGKWIISFDGQNTPECSQVNPPGFPAVMVPECFDSSGNIVVRS